MLIMLKVARKQNLHAQFAMVAAVRRRENWSEQEKLTWNNKDIPTGSWQKSDCHQPENNWKTKENCLSWFFQFSEPTLVGWQTLSSWENVGWNVSAWKINLRNFPKVRFSSFGLPAKVYPSLFVRLRNYPERIVCSNQWRSYPFPLASTWFM